MKGEIARWEEAADAIRERIAVQPRVGLGTRLRFGALGG